MAEAAQTPWGWIVAGGLALFMIGRCSASMDATKPDDVATSRVATPFLQPGEADQPVADAYVQPRTVNCRTAPATDSAIVRRLVRNQQIAVVETSAGWSRLKLEGCWVKSSLLGERPAPEPEHRPSPPERRVQSFAANSSGAYYANCSAARAAGAAPVRIGDPGYSRKLDRDGDGVGCE